MAKRKNIMIGEMAKLLNTAPSNIRFYEKEGLIEPSEILESGYRQYDIKNVGRLSDIIKLRSMGIPIKDIKNLLDNYTESKYIETLVRSKEELIHEVRELNSRIDDIDESIALAKRSFVKSSDFTIKKKERRSFLLLEKARKNNNISSKNVYDSLRKIKNDNFDFHKKDIYRLTNTNLSAIAIISDNNKEFIEDGNVKVFEGGNYLIYSFYTDNNDDALEKEKELDRYISNNKIDCLNERIYIMKNKSFVFSHKGFYGEIQVRLKN
ncbi:hypothetical protein C9J01_01245 [Photobacterium rosenbergii]|uniref:HTH merR-type domain-containing protein n=1 Tax=Photobacterium rosenbergii TaxID=294936 RepID=A0A2T3NJP5_9GAMM|nr:MerR family transcriptional regulator [Photobacterium rosenbergii]PSW15672.1 hypothetical protein C9J01_01245 [Photobacterium rosenbergii]